MVLGGGDDADPGGQGVAGVQLDGHDARIDAALAAVYDTRPGKRGGASRSGGLGKSAPGVARWLGDIRRYFPSSVVQVLQRDAIERLQLRQLLLEPEMLRAVEPDLHLVTLLVELNKLLPDATRATARQLVAQVVAQIEQRLAARTKQAVHGALARSQRTRRPRPGDIDWGRTIHLNLRHYQPELRTVIPERLVGYGRRQRSLSRDVIVAIDQSGSMADSVVYASVFSAVLASMPALRTSVVAFDTAVADLTPLLHDPVEVLFGVQLGGGTDIAQAVGYCQQLVTRPADTVVVLVSDLFEGGNSQLLHERVAALQQAGVCVMVLLALSDEGAPAYDHAQAQALADLGVPSFACTPDAFPDLLAAALEGRDVGRWANDHGLHTAVPKL
ncbi:MAG: VWA domain-containing protein [Actinomycetota bacterium]|nr:VWA domain-containing protein [Actinomycetota bacterium]